MILRKYRRKRNWVHKNRKLLSNLGRLSLMKGHIRKIGRLFLRVIKIVLN